MNNSQHQKRTSPISSRDILLELPTLVNFEALSEEQRSAATIGSKLLSTMHELISIKFSYEKLLKTADEDNWLGDDIAVIQEQINKVEQLQVFTQNAFANFEAGHSTILKPLIKAGFAVKEAQIQEQNRIALAEWRKNR